MAGPIESETDDRHISTEHRRPSMAVIDAVAAELSVDPVDMGPLADEIDPDALNDLVDSMDSGRITFPFEGFEVTVDSDGEVSIESTRTAVAEVGPVGD
ncbi:MAG: hypothetical protein ACI9PP_002126 [Halobacteriales archaeon]|jgi:hypothetical protein